MLRKLILLVAFVTAPAAVSNAQCAFGPDGLSGPCCQLVPSTLPTFPPVSLPSTAICWDNCSPTQVCTQIFLGGPAQVGCDTLDVQLSVADCTGLPQLDGIMRLDYTRTWDEDDAGAFRRLQVYRFAAKVDMNPLALPGSCLVPTCYSTYGTAFYYGYVDYAFDCTSGAVEASIMLFHNCDAFIHPSQSTHPGAFHPDMSYALVGPSTALNPFSASFTAAPGGPMSGEALRLASAGGFCVTEDRLASGDATFLASGCGCPLSPTPLQLNARILRGEGSCPGPAVVPMSIFQSANTTPTFPWYHEMATSIGNWTTSVGYPGEEAVWASEVPMFYRDACSANLGLPRAFGEVYYGGSTAGGYPPSVSSGSVPIDDRFTDLASNTSWAVPGPPPATFMGSVLPTRNLIYFNL